jgi:hypothetical protein
LVAECVIFHINADKIIQSWCWETEDTRNLLSVEEVGRLIPVDPHASEVITQEVVKRVSGEEGQAIRNPICLIWRVIEIRFGPPSQIANGLCTFLIRSGPNSQSDTIEGVRRVLLKNERVVYTVRLAATSANLNIVWETGLQ